MHQQRGRKARQSKQVNYTHICYIMNLWFIVVCDWLIYTGSLYSSSAEKVHYWSSSGRRWFSQRLPIIWLHWQVMQNPHSLYNYTVFCIIWREQEKGEEWEYFAVLVFVCGSILFSEYRKCHLAANMYCTNTWWHTVTVLHPFTTHSHL